MSRDKYLLKKYAITDKDYNGMARTHGGGCWICGKVPEVGKHLHVDHDHSLARIKVKAIKHVGTWMASSSADPLRPKLYVLQYAKTRMEAVSAVRRALLRLSVRGLLCWRCNTLLQKGHDDARIFRNAATYLDEYNQRLQ